MKLSVVIPVYNEKNTILQVIKTVRNVDIGNTVMEVVVVDDCSTDGTTELLRSQTSTDILKFYFHQHNMGKGAAVRTGFNQTTGDFIIVQDADLEYDPNEYGKLLEPLLSGKADVVFGTRFAGNDAHRVLYFWHYLGNQFLTTLSNMLSNLNLTDMETGYKVFRKEILHAITLEQNRFGFEPEITAKVAKIKGIRIYEVGISYHGRTYAEGKKISWKDGFSAIWCIIKYNLFK
ncbi:MAG TPA: glycosyltransferase family 2 protein [bacterium]|nr:glycosyltransferase family 2 protein [bacterium]HNO70621.1 glycosyltransferase family 2 protein [Bacteroidia bacterium]